MNFRDFWRKIRGYDQAFTVAFNAIVLILVVAAIFSFFQMKKSGTDGFLDTFGYQPVYIQTGSMEPAIKTKSIIITKAVDSIEDLEIGDVITYEVYDATGKTIRITHRIYNIKEDGKIITKGDNNRVADSYDLTIDNVKAKVVSVWNWAAEFQYMLATTSGKVIIGCGVGVLIVLIFLWGQLVKYLDEKYGVNDNVEESVNDKLSAYDYDYDYDGDDEDEDEGEGYGKRMRGMPNVGKFKWQDVFEYTVTDDNLITIKGIKAKYQMAVDMLDELIVPNQLFHKKVIGIGPFAFKDCGASIIKLPDTLEFIEKAAFFNCEELIYVEMPIGVKKIGANAFDGCVSLIDIELPVELTKIEDKTFRNCSTLNSVVINDKVTIIGDSAFLNCNNLSTIYGAKAVHTIKLNAFKASEENLVDTNLVTDNQYMINYNWEYFGRKAQVNDSTELLEIVKSDNDKLYEDLNTLLEQRANQKDLPDKVVETLKNTKLPKIKIPLKKAKAEQAEATPVEPINIDTTKKDSGMPELVVEKDNTPAIIEKMEKVEKTLHEVSEGLAEIEEQATEENKVE